MVLLDNVRIYMFSKVLEITWKVGSRRLSHFLRKIDFAQFWFVTTMSFGFLKAMIIPEEASLSRIVWKYTKLNQGLCVIVIVSRMTVRISSVNRFVYFEKPLLLYQWNGNRRRTTTCLISLRYIMPNIFRTNWWVYSCKNLEKIELNLKLKKFYKTLQS